ncbi:MAG: sugar phosphate isomerase/epimerase family protein [Verrucomicrobiota bacterium]
MNRRCFLAHSGAVLPAMALARGPIDRSGSPHLRLSLAAYSFRSHYPWFKGKAQKPAGGQAMSLPSFVDYCADHRIPAAELTTYFFPPDTSQEDFFHLRRLAQHRGVTISGTAIGNNFGLAPGPALHAEIAQAKQWIEKTALLGASHIRFFAGKAKDFVQDPSRMESSIAALQECADHAGQHGVVIGVENHGNLSVGQMLEILESVDSPWMGMNLDTANFPVTTDQEVNEAVTRCLPYAVNVQVKVRRKLPSPETEKVDVDLAEMISLLRQGGYQGFVVLEYEEELPFERIPETMDTLRQLLA